MPPKKAPAKAAPKKVIKKVEPEIVEVEVTQAHLDANPEWVEQEVTVGENIEVEADSFVEPEDEDSPEEKVEKMTDEEVLEQIEVNNLEHRKDAPVGELRVVLVASLTPEETPPAPVEPEATKATEVEKTEKEIVVSAKGNKSSNKATIKKAKENKEKQDELQKPTGEAAEYEIVTNLKRNGVEYKIGKKVTFTDCQAIRNLVESGCIKAI